MGAVQPRTRARARKACMPLLPTLFERRTGSSAAPDRSPALVPPLRGEKMANCSLCG